ncbi:MAG: ABC transporter permease subunit, partial [Oscillospiraceae bacterium]|nr:ABC transporter permease subunit [Oscillospiraceae bacterium]
FVMVQYALMANEWEEYGETLYFESVYFTAVPFVELFITVMIIFFLGTEYGDGTIRNKLIAGNTRTDIYSANLLTAVFVSVLLDAVFLVCGLIGLPFMECGAGFGKMLLYSAVTLFFSISTGAIVTLVGMLVTNKAGSSTISILLFFGLLIFASFLITRLNEPEMHSYMEMTSEGLQLVGPIVNPSYVGGAQRVVYECITNTLPSGQAIMLSNMELEHPVFDIAVSAFLSAAVSAAGLMIFNKKDIK